MLAGVIFDFDGVIVDSHSLHLQAWKKFFRSLGRELSDEDLSFVLEGAKREEILRHFLGDLSQEQIQIYGAEKERLFQARTGELKMVRGFSGFLAELEAAGLPLAVATSGSRRRVERTLKDFGLLDRFRAIVTGDDVANGKPDPALFQLAALKLQVRAEQILVCEDAVAGVAAAKAAGMRCVGIASNGRGRMLKDAGADLVVGDFDQITLHDINRLFTQASVSAAD
jgi:beta-phosphoglucomutase